MLKGQKGITLIALVITIIVLLILAGITISLTLGEHGILNMAEKAGDNYTNAANYEHDALNKFEADANAYIYNATH
jgi:flagellar basal body-associated protein FliL